MRAFDPQLDSRFHSAKGLGEAEIFAGSSPRKARRNVTLVRSLRMMLLKPPGASRTRARSNSSTSDWN
jgi:hypothetical protein